MKSSLRTGLIVILGVLVMLSTGGFSLARMICLKSGHTIFSLNTPEDCCKDKEAKSPYSLKDKCCDISTINVNALQYLPSSTLKISEQQAVIPFLFAPNTFQKSVATKACEFFNPLDELYSVSPPIRIFTKSFLV